MLSNYIANKRDISIIAKHGCIFKIPTLKETVGFELFINGVYEKETVDFISQRVKKGKIFFDIGANIGAISIPVCKKCDNVSLIAVEAAPWLFEYLQFNVQNNDLQNAILINKAISDVGNKHVLFYSPHDNFGKGSLLPVFTSVGVPVETVTLTQLVAPLNVEDISFMKVDIEGFEYFAFLGGTEILKKESAPDILFEFAAWAEDLAPGIKAGDAQALLMNCGYHIYKFDRGRLGEKLKIPERKNSSMLFATKNSV